MLQSLSMPWIAFFVFGVRSDVIRAVRAVCQDPGAGFFQVSFPSSSLPLTTVKCDQIVSKQFTLFSIYLINSCFSYRSPIFHCALCIIYNVFIVHNLKQVYIVSIVCLSHVIVWLLTHLAGCPEAPVCSLSWLDLRSAWYLPGLMPGYWLRLSLYAAGFRCIRS